MECTIVVSKEMLKIDGTHSVFQENILRNISFCEKYKVLVPNDVDIENMVNEQLQVFQGLKYEIIKEDVIVSEKSNEKIIKLLPSFKDYLWGGTKLRDVYGKDCDLDIIAESWELSAHEAGPSIIASGEYEGKTFIEYLEDNADSVMGWKSRSVDRFPILIKFIDACNALSIQIHPDDEYALKNENELGKNEMWYVMDCEEGAALYWGVNRDITKEEVRRRVEDNTILEVLNEVKVKKGDVIYVEAGTIHAIGKGIMICEIQQNSNCTYRLYDYDRRDKDGNPRELHLDKAIDVLNPVIKGAAVSEFDEEKFDGYTKRVLARCKYFQCTKYEVSKEVSVESDDTSFVSITIIDGNGKICSDNEEFEFKTCDSFFVPAGSGRITIKGQCSFIESHV